MIKRLSDELSLRDLEDLNYFLGIKVKQHKQGLLVSQQKYLTNFLVRNHMHGAKPTKTPIATSPSLSKQDGTLLFDPTFYRTIVGALQYATIKRPDVACPINKLCQFMSTPTEVHWQVVKWVLQYVQDTLGHGLYFTPSSISLQAF